MLGADNFTSYRLEVEQINFTGPRTPGGQPSSIQDVFARTQPRVYLQIRKTF